MSLLKSATILHINSTTDTLSFASPISLNGHSGFLTKPKCIAATTNENVLKLNSHQTLSRSRKATIFDNTKACQSDTSKKTPVHWRVPVFGILIDEARGISNTDLMQRYGPVFRTDIYGQQFLVVNERKSIEMIGRDTERFHIRGSWPDALDNALGNDHLSNIDGTYHKSQRAMIQPIFSSQAILKLQPFVEESAHRMWAAANASIEKDGKVKLAPLVKNHLADCMIQQWTCGNFTVAQVDEVKSLLNTLAEGLFLPRWTAKGRRTYESRLAILDMLKGLLKSITTERADIIEELRAGTDLTELIQSNKYDIMSAKVDLITVLIAASSIPTQFDNSEIAELEKSLHDIASVILHLWWAASDTSTSLTLSAIDNLWKQPGAHNTLSLEQQEVASSKQVPGGEYTSMRQYITEFPALASYIEENLRFRSPVASTARMAKVNTSVLGHAIKPGERIQLNFAMSNKDPGVYDDPLSFKADRFIPRLDRKSPPPVLSFGVGGSPHVCIGNALARATVMTTLRSLVAHYDFTFNPEQDQTWKDLPVPAPSSGIELIHLEPKQFQKVKK